jgi:hypothetical protein
MGKMENKRSDFVCDGDSITINGRYYERQGAAFTLEEIAAMKAGTYQDALHLNAEGFETMAKESAPKLEIAMLRDDLERLKALLAEALPLIAFNMKQLEAQMRWEDYNMQSLLYERIKQEIQPNHINDVIKKVQS